MSSLYFSISCRVFSSPYKRKSLPFFGLRNYDYLCSHGIKINLVFLHTTGFVMYCDDQVATSL